MLQNFSHVLHSLNTDCWMDDNQRTLPVVEFRKDIAGRRVETARTATHEMLLLRGWIIWLYGDLECFIDQCFLWWPTLVIDYLRLALAFSRGVELWTSRLFMHSFLLSFFFLGEFQEWHFNAYILVDDFERCRPAFGKVCDKHLNRRCSSSHRIECCRFHGVRIPVRGKLGNSHRSSLEKSNFLFGALFHYSLTSSQ